ncbi:NUDIX domain-containing protein, partial [Streptomyces sp. A13(2022)]
MSAADEILDVVDENDHVVGRARRGDVYARGLCHRCVFIWASDPEGRVFVHRRTATKLAFPDLYDMFVGGVVGAGESYDDAALREAEEELGVSGLPRPEYLFKFLYDDGDGRTWWSAVYEVE